MAEYISFAPKTATNSDIGKVVVTVIDDQNQILLTEAFGALVNHLEITVISLEPGTYTLWARADGHVFAFPTTITVNADDGPTALTPRVIDLVATGASTATEQSSAGFCRVYGWVGLDVPGGTVNRRAAGFGVVEKTQFGTNTEYDRTVRVWRISADIPGEAATLHTREALNYAIDRNGRWEALLTPESLYRVDMPNIAGQPYFTTPAAGLDAEVTTLIDANRSSAPYDLIGGS